MERKQTITACALIVRDGKVFIAKRVSTKKFLPNKFELPGGHVEFGETPEEGLKRELMEEMNLEIDIGMPFYAFTYTRDSSMDHCIEVDYLATLKHPKQEIKLKPEDHSEYKWISEAEISRYFNKDDDEGKAVSAGFEAIRKMKV